MISNSHQIYPGWASQQQGSTPLLTSATTSRQTPATPSTTLPMGLDAPRLRLTVWQETIMSSGVLMLQMKINITLWNSPELTSWWTLASLWTQQLTSVKWKEDLCRFQTISFPGNWVFILMLPFYKPGLRSLRNGATTPLPRGFPPNARSRRLQDPKLQRRACQVQRLPAQVVFDFYFCGSGWALGTLLISHNNDNSGEVNNDWASFSSGGLQTQEQCTPARQLVNLLSSLQRLSSGPSR